LYLPRTTGETFLQAISFLQGIERLIMEEVDGNFTSIGAVCDETIFTLYLSDFSPIVCGARLHDIHIIGEAIKFLGKASHTKKASF
jgi:hypothetical protein